ncbi:MAG: hypothetical protein C0478_14035 [Planctomyces sp.]|nr:hypothetical protein [Planctomyces sp.]
MPLAEETKTELSVGESSFMRQFVERRQQILENTPMGQAFKEATMSERYRVLIEKRLQVISNSNELEGEEGPLNGWSCHYIIHNLEGVDKSGIQFPENWKELTSRPKAHAKEKNTGAQ